MQLSTVEARTRRVYFSSLAMAHTIFVLTGIVTVMLGPLLPVLAAKWSLNDNQSGYLISAQFLGALLGTLSTSFLLARLRFRWPMVMGQVVMAMGVANLIWDGFATGAAAVFCYGVGIGLTIPTGNLMVAESDPARRSSTLNLLNFSWGAGAVSCPFLLAQFQKVHQTQLFLSCIALLLVAMTAVLLTSSSDLPAPTQQHNSTGTARVQHDLFRNPAAIMLAILFFVYVGIENALGAWLASYARRATGLPLAAWMTVPSFFYGALLLGRVLAPLTLKQMADAGLASLGAVLAALSSIALIFSRSVLTIGSCAFLAGLGLSTLYPIAISLFAGSFGRNATQVGGLMFALSTLGGASVPWLVGLVSSKFNGLRAGLMITPVGCLLMLAIFSRPRWKQLTT